MVVSINLSPEEADILNRHAGAAGMNIETLLHRLIATLVEHSDREGEQTGARPADDPEGQAEAERDRTEMRNNIRRWREEQARGE